MDTQTHDIILSDALVKRVRELQTRQNNPGLMLRVGVLGGGCQGFEYRFTPETAREDDDHIFEKDGVRVLVDEMSLDLLRGATIDFVDDLVGASFKVHNPNAKSSCGCGTSFSV